MTLQAAAELAPRRERRALAGWPGLALGLAAGGAAGLAHPPFGFAPGLLGFALLLHLVDSAPPGRPLRAAFGRGWAAGFAYFLVSTWWVGEAFMVDAATHAWQAPFAVTLLPAGLALFWGAAAVAYRLVAPVGVRRVLVFAALFGLVEWLRGHVLTGFPWDLPGEAWAAGSALSQGAALVGAYGMSVLTLAVAAAPGVLGGLDARSRKATTVGIAAAALAALWTYGMVRLAGARAAPTGLVVRVVQPDIPQAVKWSPEAFRSIVERYVSLTGAPGARRPDVVVWPEAAIPATAEDLFAPGAWTEAAIAGALAPGQTLLAGVVRTQDGRDYNSLLALRRTGPGFAVLGVYDKHQLVPFGEYLPMEGLLTRLGLKKLTAVEGGFSTGPVPAPLSLPGLPRVQPLICYESLFPSFTASTGGRPAWIVNVSNDAWFGRTSGPLQHLNLASYRAIEEGLPLVRATPTGVSAFVDAWGRPLATLASGRGGMVDGVLTAPASPTVYSHLRDAPYWLMTMIGLACAWPGRQRSRR